jgi:hypothetical protein
MKAIHLMAYGNPAQNLRWSKFRNQTRRLRARLLCGWSMRRLPVPITRLSRATVVAALVTAAIAFQGRARD